MTQEENIKKHLDSLKAAYYAFQSNRTEEIADYEADEPDAMPISYWISLGQKLGMDYAMGFLKLYTEFVHIELAAK